MPAKKTSRKEKKKQVAKKEEPLFVGLPEAENIQRHILESTKESLIVLKKLEEIKDLRKQKMQSVDVLASLMSEIKSLNIKLKKKIPTKIAKQLLSEQNTDTKEKVVITKKAVAKPVPNKPQTELEKLEAELASIETRLKRV